MGENFGGSKLVAYDPHNIKSELFSTILVREDMPMVAIGILLIFFTILFFSGSTFFAILSFLQAHDALLWGGVPDRVCPRRLPRPILHTPLRLAPARPSSPLRFATLGQANSSQSDTSCFDAT